MNYLSQKTSLFHRSTDFLYAIKASPCKEVFSFIRGISIILSIFLTPTVTYTQIWTEDFNAYPDGTTNTANWTTTATDCDDPGLNNGNQWGVFSGQFVINDVEGAPCCLPDVGGGNDNTWTSGLIDIGDYCQVNISLSVSASGSMECNSPDSPLFGCQGATPPDNSHDQVVLEYILDGGSPVQFGYVCGMNGIGPITVDGLNGSTLQIQISGATKSDSEFYFFDDIVVDGTLCLCDRMADSLTLVEFYTSTNGPTSWTNQWDLLQPMDTWHGIFLNSDGCVTCIDLDGNPNCNEFADVGNGLMGTIPSSIGNLTRLQKIYLGINSLTGNIPAEIGNLGRLKELYMSGNNLDGPIPNTIGNLKNLEKLFLPGNALDGNIPSEIGNLTNLLQLYLNGNQLNGNIPTTLGNLTKVENFALSDNLLNGPIPNELGNIASVVTLFLNDNQLSGSIPTSLGDLGFLSSLSLGHNQLTGNIPSSLGNLSGLTQLLLSNNFLDGSIPASLGSLNNLGELYLADNMLNGSIPPELGNLSSLTEFHLNDNNLEGCFPDEIMVHCGITYNTSNNPLLPWQGDFQKFCDGEPQIGATCNDGDAVTINDIIQVDCSCHGSANTCPPPGMPPIGANCSVAPLSCLGIDGYCGELGTDNSATVYPGCPSNVLNNDDWIAFVAGSTEITLEITPINCQGQNMQVGMQGGITEGSCFGVAIALQCVCTNAAFQLSSTNFTIGEIYYLVLDGCAGDICEYQINVLTGTTFAPPMSPAIINGPTIATEGASVQYSVPAQNFTSYNWSISPPSMGTITSTSSTDTVNIEWNTTGTAQLCVTASNACFNNPTPSCVTVNVIDPASSCQLTDSLALVALYNSTNGVNWTNPWDLAQPMSTWYGVTLNADGCVICLDLDGEDNCSMNCCSTGNNLSGTLPPDLGSISQLQTLTLKHNQISGGIPPQLGNLSSLEFFDLGFNQLTGSIPPELGNLSNLFVIELDNNQLSGKIPIVMANMGNLIALHLFQNNLTDTIPKELSNLSALVSLRLDANQLTGSIPVELSALSNLTQIDLSGNQLSGSIPPELGLLTNMQFLHLASNNLSGPIPNELGNLSNLIQLLLQENQLSGLIPSTLGNLFNLTMLRINDNDLEGCFPSELVSLCNITYDFTNNPLLPWQGDFQMFCDGEPQIGVVCDDGNAITSNDVIQNDCSCLGSSNNSIPELTNFSNSGFSIEYNDSVDPTTINAANLKIWGEDRGLRTFTSAVAGNVVTITLDIPFLPAELITITTTDQVLSTNGNPMPKRVWIETAKATVAKQVFWDTVYTGINIPEMIEYSPTLITSDFNKDGLVDILAKHITVYGAPTFFKVFLQNPDGSFQFSQEYTFTESHSSINQTSDFNADGYPDLLFLINTPSRMKLYLNNQDGTFTLSQTINIPPFAGGSFCTDIDGDGDMDVLVSAGIANLSQNTFSVLFNNGAGIFGSPVSYPLPSFGGGFRVGDLDKDGDLDVLHRTSTSFGGTPYYVIYKNNGNGVFSQESIYDNPSNNSICGLAGLYDFNNDGILDFLSSGYADNMEFWIGQNDYSFVKSNPTPGKPTWVDDLDGDGEWDLIEIENVQSLSNKINTFIGNGDGTFDVIEQSVEYGVYRWGEGCDFDNDGDVDYSFSDINGDLYFLVNSCQDNIFPQYGTTCDEASVGNLLLTSVINQFGCEDQTFEVTSLTSPINPDGLIAYFPFIGNVNDMSGWANDGIVNGASLTDDRFGNEESAYIFSAFPQTVSFSDYAFPNELRDVSISCWVQTSSASSNQGILSFARDTDFHNEMMLSLDADGTTLFYLKDPNVGDAFIHGSVPVNDGMWHNLTATRNSATGVCKIYIDGVLDTEGLLPTGILKIAANGVVFGNDQDCPGGCLGSDRQFIGSLDDIYIFNKILSDTEIQEIFNAPWINPQFEVTIDSTICEGETVEIGSSVFILTGSYTETLVSANSGCDSIVHLNLTVNPAPTATITPDGATTFCQGGSVSLEGPTGAGYNYQWQQNGINILGSISTSHIVNTSGDYTLIVTDANSCTAASTPQNVTINPLPNATITPASATTFCQGGNVVLNGMTSPGFTYQWQLNSINILGGISASHTATSSGDYTLIVTDSNSCTAASIAQTVTVNPLPTTTITPASATTFCQGGSVVLNSSPTPGSTYQWQLNSNNIPGATSASHTATISGDYTLMVIDANSCTATSTPQTVSVNPLPTPTITPTESSGLINDDGILCLGDNVTLTATGGTGYVWDNGETTTTISITPISNEVFTVTVTDGNNCTNETNFGLTVNPLPTAVAGDDLSACGSAQLDGTSSSPAPNLAYQWSTVNGMISNGANTAMPTIGGEGIYQLMVTDQTTGCTDSDEIAVLIGGMIDIDLISSDPTCVGIDNGFIEIGQVLNGTPPFQFILNGTSQGTITLFENLPPGSYLLEAIDAGGCNVMASISLAAPDTIGSLLGPDTLIAVGQSIKLQVSVNALYYTWISDHLNTLSCDDCQSPLASPVLPGGYNGSEPYLFEYMVEVEIEGCGIQSDTIVIAMFRDGDPFPVVVTPNGDGFNDKFEIIDLDNANFSELLIINRWGETVFLVNPLEKDWSNSWVGYDNNKNELPEGTYYYILAVQYGSEPKKTILGPTILIRERD